MTGMNFLSLARVNSGLTALLIFLTGCSEKKIAVKDVAGNFARSGVSLSEIVVINADGTFVQIVTSTNGQSWHLTNTWTLKPRGVTFNQFLVTFDAEHQIEINPPSKFFFFTCHWKDNHLVHSEEGPYVFFR